MPTASTEETLSISRGSHESQVHLVNIFYFSILAHSNSSRYELFLLFSVSCFSLTKPNVNTSKTHDSELTS